MLEQKGLRLSNRKQATETVQKGETEPNQSCVSDWILDQMYNEPYLAISSLQLLKVSQHLDMNVQVSNFLFLIQQAGLKPGPSLALLPC